MLVLWCDTAADMLSLFACYVIVSVERSNLERSVQVNFVSMLVPSMDTYLFSFSSVVCIFEKVFCFRRGIRGNTERPIYVYTGKSVKRRNTCLLSHIVRELGDLGLTSHWPARLWE